MKMQVARAKLTAVATGLALLAGGFLTSVPAQAATPEDGFGTSEQSMITVWTEHGVPAATQDALLEKLRSGAPLDSMTGADAVSSTSSVEGTKQVVVSQYPDGSISISTIAPESSMARSVSGCSVNAASYATNCEVYGWFGGVELHFRSSYTKADQHASVYNWGQVTFLCGPAVTCSTPKFELVRQYQSGSSAAQINLNTTWSTPLANGSTSLKLYARDRSAWTN